MLRTDNPPSNEVESIRAKLMEDLAEIDVFARAARKSPRTIHRLIAQGKIPTVCFGRTRYVVVTAARTALMTAKAA